MANPVEGYENCPNFHVGMKCKVNGFPYQLMYENGEYSLEAEAIALTAWKRKAEPNRINYKTGDTVTVVCLFGNNVEAYEFDMPKHISNMQSFVLI